MMSGSNVDTYDEDGMRIVVLAAGTYGDVLRVCARLGFAASGAPRICYIRGL
jgi:hypothetical protein